MKNIMRSKDKSLGYSEPASSLYRTPGSSRAETAVFGTLGLVSLAALGIAVTWGSTPGESHTSPLASYFRSGQATADLRTAKSAIEYLMEPDTPNLTNFIEPAQRNLAMPTNSGVAKPKA